MARKIKICAATKVGLAQHRVQHADDFCAFLVHRGSVEIVDLGVFSRPHRVRQRSAVLLKLAALQQAYVVNALQRARMQIGAEFLIPKHRETFL